MQRWRVVDAVAEKAHHVTAVLEREDNPVLLAGRYARENIGLLRHLRERGVAHRFDLISQHDARDGDSHPLADMAGHQLVIPSYNLYRHSVPAERGKRTLHSFQRGVDEG